MKKTILFLILISLIFIGIFVMNHNSKSNSEIIFGTTQIPFSSDPLDFDYYTHHYAFSSVFAKLVSTEKSGEVFPMLSSEWKNEKDFTVWKFKIRNDLNYSNGDAITIHDIMSNFRRVAYLKKKNDSKSGLVENLKGYDLFNNLDDKIEGLAIENDWLVFSFTKPMPNLLDIISFGFYGLAHPELYDARTGIWNKELKPISSSTYDIALWDKNNYIIELRKDSKFISLDYRVKRIKFYLIQNIKESKDLDNVDLLVSDKSSLLINNKFEYVGSQVNFKIGYLKCHSWNKATSPFYRLEVRKWFRQAFYNSLEDNKFNITHSFFPLNIQGIRPIKDKELINKPSFDVFKILTHPIGFSAKLKENAKTKSIAEIFSEALVSLGKNTGAEIEQVDLPEDNLYDVAISGTGMESINYLDTVKFMFLSKEGIQLPDSTGLIKQELEKEQPDINFINQEIWNQAIIWPIRHYSSGYWFNKNSNLDYSELNFESASIDFQFLKFN